MNVLHIAIKQHKNPQRGKLFSVQCRRHPATNQLQAIDALLHTLDDKTEQTNIISKHISLNTYNMYNFIHQNGSKNPKNIEKWQ